MKSLHRDASLRAQNASPLTCVKPTAPKPHCYSKTLGMLVAAPSDLQRFPENIGCHLNLIRSPSSRAPSQRYNPPWMYEPTANRERS